jgi:hypothetical protein
MWGVKRYDLAMVGDNDGLYVLFADHESALAAARQEERDRTQRFISRLSAVMTLGMAADARREFERCLWQYKTEIEAKESNDGTTA